MWVYDFPQKINIYIWCSVSVGVEWVGWGLVAKAKEWKTVGKI
jgi:hypothetical protein